MAKTSTLKLELSQSSNEERLKYTTAAAMSAFDFLEVSLIRKLREDKRIQKGMRTPHLQGLFRLTMINYDIVPVHKSLVDWLLIRRGLMHKQETGIFYDPFSVIDEIRYFIGSVSGQQPRSSK